MLAQIYHKIPFIFHNLYFLTTVKNNIIQGLYLLTLYDFTLNFSFQPQVSYNPYIETLNVYEYKQIDTDISDVEI